MATTTNTARWGSIATAAQEANVSIRTIRRMISRGDIYAERISQRRIRVDLDSIHGTPLQYVGGGDQ